MSSFDAARALDLPALPIYIEQLERRIVDVLATDNKYLQASVAHLLQVRGKRLRPSLLIAVAASQGHEIDNAAVAGCVAIELVHLASLVHDDIMDETDTRWGLPTIHAREGSAQAILVGDYLLAKACQEATTISSDAARVITAAIASLVDGQARELADKFNLDRTQEAYFQAIKGKTASLFLAACRLGGMHAGLDAAACSRFAAFGENFGMAFQLTDDVLDFISTPELSGKPIGNDIAEGVYTLPVLLALDGPHREALTALLAKQQKADRNAVIEIILRSGTIERTLATAHDYSHKATQILQAHNNEQDTAVSLQKLPSAYTRWALTQLVAMTYRPIAAASLPDEF